MVGPTCFQIFSCAHCAVQLHVDQLMRTKLGRPKRRHGCVDTGGCVCPVNPGLSHRWRMSMLTVTLSHSADDLTPAPQGGGSFSPNTANSHVCCRTASCSYMFEKKKKTLTNLSLLVRLNIPAGRWADKSEDQLMSTISGPCMHAVKHTCTQKNVLVKSGSAGSGGQVELSGQLSAPWSHVLHMFQLELVCSTRESLKKSLTKTGNTVTLTQHPRLKHLLCSVSLSVLGHLCTTVQTVL